MDSFLDGFKQLRINQKDTFSDSKMNHINEIENCWGYARTNLKRDHRVGITHFYLYLKEMEFRYNHRKEDFWLVIGNILERN